MHESTMAGPENRLDELLSARDPAPFEVLSAGSDFPALVVCDHASRAMPAHLGDLGLSPELLSTHIAWDIGAASLATGLSERLGATAVLAGYSRLVVDCNRRLDDPTAFPEQSDGVPVPGNQGLVALDRQQRVNAIYWPYHHAIRAELGRLEKIVAAPALIAVHTFTPVFGGFPRPWHAGILWDRDPRIAVPLIRRLSALTGVAVGDNEPYSGRHPADFTVDHHAEDEGLPCVSIEIRQDLVCDAAGASRWSDYLAEALAPILVDELFSRWSGA